MITAIQLAEFKTIIMEDYGVSLSDKDAEKLASDYLISLEAVLSRNPVDSRSERSKNDNQRLIKNENESISNKTVLPVLLQKK